MFKDLNFFYSSGSMGIDGKGYFWHKLLGFHPPAFPVVTKTITLKRKIGTPFMVIPLGNSVYNKYGLHNQGFDHWLENHYDPELIVSIHGTDDEISEMVGYLNRLKIKGIELNYSCPNVESPRNKKVPSSIHPLYLKLSYLQDPYQFDLTNIKEIRLNSVPMYGGGISGKMAQQYNWEFISKFGKELPVAGCSFICEEDIQKLVDLGCTSFGIGTVMMINRKFVLGLGYE